MKNKETIIALILSLFFLLFLSYKIFSNNKEETIKSKIEVEDDFLEERKQEKDEKEKIENEINREDKKEETIEKEETDEELEKLRKLLENNQIDYFETKEGFGTFIVPNGWATIKDPKNKITNKTYYPNKLENIQSKDMITRIETEFKKINLSSENDYKNLIESIEKTSKDYIEEHKDRIESTKSDLSKTAQNSTLLTFTIIEKGDFPCEKTSYYIFGEDKLAIFNAIDYSSVDSTIDKGIMEMVHSFIWEK